AAEGGALSYAGSAAAVLSYVTITDNSSGLSHAGTGTLTIDSSIVTGNGSLDCSVGIDSGDYNVFGEGGDASGCPVGAFDAVPSGDAGTVIDPLTDNGGPTDTHPVFHGSPAIGLVPAFENGCGLTATLDQRGEARPSGDPCEAGAYDGDSVPVELMQFSIE
ncbi:MAG: choice-of-anchor Q domain-containing protein, partial [Acidobacteriota bacterium]